MLPDVLLHKLSRLSNYPQKNVPTVKCLFAQACAAKERIAITYEKVNGQHWTKLCLRCAVPVNPKEAADLQDRFNLKYPFNDSLMMDFRKAHKLITGTAMSDGDHDILINFLRTSEKGLGRPEKIVESQFFKALLRLDYGQLERLIPELQKYACNTQPKHIQSISTEFAKTIA